MTGAEHTSFRSLGGLEAEEDDNFPVDSSSEMFNSFNEGSGSPASGGEQRERERRGNRSGRKSKRRSNKRVPSMKRESNGEKMSKEVDLDDNAPFRNDSEMSINYGETVSNSKPSRFDSEISLSGEELLAIAQRRAAGDLSPRRSLQKDASSQSRRSRSGRSLSPRPSNRKLMRDDPSFQSNSSRSLRGRGLTSGSSYRGVDLSPDRKSKRELLSTSMRSLSFRRARDDDDDRSTSGGGGGLLSRLSMPFGSAQKEKEEGDTSLLIELTKKIRQLEREKGEMQEQFNQQELEHLSKIRALEKGTVLEETRNLLEEAQETIKKLESENEKAQEEIESLERKVFDCESTIEQFRLDHPAPGVEPRVYQDLREEVAAAHSLIQSQDAHIQQLTTANNGENTPETTTTTELKMKVAECELKWKEKLAQNSQEYRKQIDHWKIQSNNWKVRFEQVWRDHQQSQNQKAKGNGITNGGGSTTSTASNSSSTDHHPSQAMSLEAAMQKGLQKQSSKRWMGGFLGGK